MRIYTILIALMIMTGFTPGQSGEVPTTINTISILIKFSGEGEFSQPRSYYNGIFNNQTGQSLYTYYMEVSYGKINIVTGIYPTVSSGNLSYTFPRQRGYFQPYSGSNTIGYKNIREARLREHEILDSAVTAMLPQINDSVDVDFNGDGLVDNVMFIIRGSSGAWGDVGLWPHSGVLDSYDVRINGSRVYHYSIQLETYIDVYTFCHETFHVFGAPDLYRYFTSGTPVGSWDLMASGTVHMLAYMKYKYTNRSWISDIPVITKSGTYTLNPLASPTNNCYRINSPYTEDEFFIVEYRRKTGTYESGVPGSGLIIYRVNTKTGEGNGSGPPDEIYIFRQNGTPTSWGSSSQANFSSSTGRTAINDYNTNPKSFLSNGSPAGLDIRNVGTAGETITFEVRIVDCEFVYPGNYSSFRVGTNVELEVSVKDTANTALVEFYRDSLLIGTATGEPFRTKWLTTNVCLGRHTMRARVISNTGVYKEDSITVYVTQGEPVVIFRDAGDSLVVGMGDSLNIPVDVLTADSKIERVDYYLDDDFIYTQTTPPFRLVWQADTISYGWHTFKAEAFDTSGEMDFSELDIKVVKYLAREGFEGEWVPEGWTINSDVWGWYLSEKGAFDGRKCAATRNYHTMGEAILETPEMLIEEEGRLEFYWMDRSLDITSPLITGHDTTYCEISVNGGAYSVLKVLSSQEAQSVYQKESIDLVQYEGQRVKIRWRDVSDEELEAQGTALDNIAIITIPKPTGVKVEGENIPADYMLSQNYPNPFNPSTVISYQIPVNSHVSLKLFDILGNEVSTLVDGEREAGRYEVRLDASKLASGVYFYNLRAGGFNGTRKLVVLK
ncbi:MAG: M6 family metalloprotease domain-containing protein [Ignavibacteriaceae bacterium]